MGKPRNIFLLSEILQCCICQKKSIEAKKDGSDLDLLTIMSNSSKTSILGDFEVILNKYDMLSPYARTDFRRKVFSFTRKNFKLFGSTDIEDDIDSYYDKLLQEIENEFVIFLSRS